MRPTDVILFLCTGNSCRSQMAEGFACQLFPEGWRVESAGIEAHGQNPLAIRVMAEEGVDISRQRSKNIEELGAIQPKVVITLCGDAQERCPVFPGGVHREHWGLPDPARATGDEKARLSVYRSVRDEIGRRVADLAQRLARSPL